MADFCPWDERRLPREMHVKLFVVHFVTIGTYGHLMHLRHERRGPFIYLLMILCPIAGAGLVLVPLIALLIQAILHRRDKAVLRYSFALLLGRLPENTVQGESGRLPQNKRQDERGENQRDRLFRPPEINVKLVRTLVVQLVSLIQSILSIWLYSRRVHRGSAALYDHRILQLAILGLCASFMSIVHLLTNPQCLPELPRLDIAWRRRWITLLRPTYRNRLHYFKFRGEVYNLQPLIIAVTEWVVAGAMFTIFRGIGILATKMIVTSFWGSGIFYILIWFLQNYTHHVLFLSILAVIQFRKFLPSLDFSSWRQPAWFLVKILIALSLFNILIMSTLFVFLILVECFTGPLQCQTQLLYLFGKPWNFKDYEIAVYDPDVSNSKTLRPDWDRIWTYGHTPSTFPCPEAKKDPAADYVWWLA